MIVIALLVVLAGASGLTRIAWWAALKEKVLFQTQDLPHGNKDPG